MNRRALRKGGFPAALASVLTLGLISAVLAPGESRADTITVFLLGGQSNGAGFGDPADLSGVLAAPQPDVFLYHGKDDADLPADTWLSLQPGSNALGFFGPELAFGRAMSDAIGSDSNSVAIIKDALGGTSLASEWAAGGDDTTAGDGAQYQAFQSTVDSGLASLSAMFPSETIVLGGMMWMQGESDTIFLSDAEAYAPNLEVLIEDLRLTYDDFLPFSIGGLSINQSALPPAHLGIVRDAQAAVAGADPLTGLVDTDSLVILADGLHFDSASQVALGEAFAANLLSIPEPSTGLLLLSGLALLRWKRGRAAPSRLSRRRRA